MIDEKAMEEQVLAEVEQQLQLTGRHGLDYGRLYHGLNGGYNVEKLKDVLERAQQDRADYLTKSLISDRDFPEGAESAPGDDQLEFMMNELPKIIRKRLKAKAQKKEEGGEDEDREETGRELFEKDLFE